MTGLTTGKYSEKRFEFGKNWSKFLTFLNENRINAAKETLKQMLEIDNLNGKSFLDIGSGSGLFSLAARQLGAKVYSFDYDPNSVACTLELKKRCFWDDTDWIIEQGDIFDTEYIKSLGKFDIVYSWGVLHHTGNLSKAIENVKELVCPGGLLFIAIYNDQGYRSKYWNKVKLLYNKNIFLRVMLIVIHIPYLYCGRILVRLLTNRLRDPNNRGMSYWYDMLDWLGGYPFEVAKPERVVSLFSQSNFTLVRLNTYGGKSGCNEYVFKYSP